MMNHILVGRKFILKNRDCEIIEKIDANTFIAIDTIEERRFNIGTEDFAREIFKGNLELLNFNGTGINPVPFFDVSLLPEKDRKLARKRYAYVQAVLKLARGEKGYKNTKRIIEKTAKVIGDTTPPSVTSVRRWRKFYLDSGKDFRSLFDRNRDKGSKKKLLDKMIFILINEAMEQCYQNDPNASYQDIHGKTLLLISRYNKKIDKANEQRLQNSIDVPLYKRLSNPSYLTIYRHVKDIDDFEKDVIKFGASKASKIHRVIGAKKEPTLPLERVEMDHTLLDFYVVDDDNGLPIGRPWLTSAIDVFSRTVCGIHISFENPSYASVMECMYHSFLPKDYVKKRYPSVNNTWGNFGKFTTLFVDNGPDFTSTYLEEACKNLNIELQYSPPYQPWYKAVVERFFGVQNQKLLNHQPGTTYSAFFKKYDPDFKPHKNAIISFNSLLEIIHIFIVDIYHQDYHQGLNDIPAKVWEMAVNEVSIIPPAKTRDELLILLMPHKKRKLLRNIGIEFKGLKYNCRELGRLRRRLQSKKVYIKFDPSDISIIYAYDPDSHQYIVVPAVNQQYTRGLTMRQHDTIRRFRREICNSVDRVSLEEAKERILLIVQKEQEKLRTTGRKAVARFKGIKQPREGSHIEFSKDATEILDQLKQCSHDEKNPGGRILSSNEIHFHRNSSGYKPNIKRAKFIKTRKHLNYNKNTKKQTTIKSISNDIVCDTIELDDDRRWGSTINE